MDLSKRGNTSKRRDCHGRGGLPSYRAMLMATAGASQGLRTGLSDRERDSGQREELM